MVNIAIFASGRGSNFEALTRAFLKNGLHKVKILIHDKENIPAIRIAYHYGVKNHHISYKNGKNKAETEILELMENEKIDIIFLAGYMKIITGNFINNFSKPIINLHPSLLPHFKGKESILEAFKSNHKKSGITIHHVSEKIDSGEIIFQQSVPIIRKNGFHEFKELIHQMEHYWYPKIALQLCSQIENKKK